MHFAGFASVPVDVPVGTLVVEMHFVQRRNQELSSTATCIDAVVRNLQVDQSFSCSPVVLGLLTV